MNRYLKTLKLKQRGLYAAGAPNYGSNFSRDSLIYGLMADDQQALKAQIRYSAEHQGRKNDSLTGEELGKIHHELPSVAIGDKQTAYNACDTTGLFLLALARVGTHDRRLLKRLSRNIEDALNYIEAHTREHIFIEDPSLLGADRFALAVTYWKDSVLNSPDGKATFPISYSLAHFQNAAGLLAIGELLGRAELLERGREMTTAGIAKFWRDDHFVSAIDGNGRVFDLPSTDSLHILRYITPELLPEGYAEKIENYSRVLETAAGYKAGRSATDLPDRYHTDFVWVFEQAEIHKAARMHGLAHAAEVSQRVRAHLADNFPELIDPKTLAPSGNPTQLWSIGAAQYFASRA